MTLEPSLEEAKKIAGTGQYRIIPLGAAMYSDEITPITLLKKLKKQSSHCFILESAEDAKKWGRYTFLGFDPQLEITCERGLTTIKAGGETTTASENPNLAIQRILDEHKSAKFAQFPPFTGGLVGYFAYDYAKYVEPSLNLGGGGRSPLEGEDFKDVDLMLFDKVIAFDNFLQKLIIIVNMRAEDIENSYKNAAEEIARIADIIRNGEPATIAPPEIKSEFRQLFDKNGYMAMVEKAKHYIREGDIFQVVLSNRFAADFAGSIFDTYRVLRTINPSPYMFYFSGSAEIAGASPETLVKLQDGRLHTFPLAGTRPRGETDEADLSYEKSLLADAKELAEHNMLVDLGRNDLGKISKFGTVSVDEYLKILRFSHVMHIGSTVSGKLLPGKTGLDAINAVLPAGTLSGAPKIRAMQIIDELEQCKRGIYGGAIGYLDFTGNMDTCIAIRIAYRKGNQVYVRSGAGIVADSVHASEYEECVNKSKAVMAALEDSHSLQLRC
ncbi:MAG: chorismate-binding protein [Lachnospiraceae bacterium]|jgi:anthranilate synthase component 1|nr:chorismate-binding protein [Lachnospiraceae bacterium]